MNAQLPVSVANVVDVEVLRGPAARRDALPDLLIEVPHGADERRHYDALRERLHGDLPADLHLYFNLNTDIGAWQYGRATARALLAAAPGRTILLLRCLIPRTFVDCNRRADYQGGRPEDGALTAGIPSYVRAEPDRALLLELHEHYCRVARQAFATVCGAGGLALVPHTYGPRTLGIDAIDDDIISRLRWACAPERHDTWPLRAEVDLLTRDADDTCWAPEGLEARLLADFTAAGFGVRANEAFRLHPGSLAHEWSTSYPGQVLCLEVRRDALVERWTPFEPMTVVSSKCERVASVLAPALSLEGYARFSRDTATR